MKKKVTAIQIAGFGSGNTNRQISKSSKIKKENPEKKLKELELDTNPEWTIHYFFKPHMGGIMYETTKKKKGGENG